MSDREYHESERRIARDAGHPAHILPPKPKPGAYVLDVGCGAGQTILAVMPDQFAVGVDIDPGALRLGRDWSQGAAFTCAFAETLPFPDATFDCVWARVSLAYTDLRRSLDEIRRVLKPGGSLWIVLHPLSVPLASARSGGLKAWLFFGYIVLNSLQFHAWGRMFSLRGRYESFQLAGSMTRELKRRGFHQLETQRGRHFVMTARLG